MIIARNKKYLFLEVAFQTKDIKAESPGVI
jgi:hypothetical protein